MVMRSIGLNCYETSKFNNELFYPSFVDEFFVAAARGAPQMLARCTTPTTPASRRA